MFEGWAFTKRFPSGIIWITIFLLFLYGQSQENCQKRTWAYRVGILIAGLLMGGSLFAGVFPIKRGHWTRVLDLRWTLHSTLIRSAHQATRFYHVMEEPPALVYVTDGGIEDATGLVELARRK